MPLWEDEPKFELQVLGRFLWKLTAVILVTLAVFALVGLLVETVVDSPASETRELTEPAP